MSIVLRTLDGDGTLLQHEAVIRQSERLGYRLVSLASGRIGRQPAVLAVFRSLGDVSPDAEVALVELDGGLSETEQQTAINDAPGDVVCFGGIFVEGRERNVLALR